MRENTWCFLWHFVIIFSGIPFCVRAYDVFVYQESFRTFVFTIDDLLLFSVPVAGWKDVTELQELVRPPQSVVSITFGAPRSFPPRSTVFTSYLSLWIPSTPFYLQPVGQLDRYATVVPRASHASGRFGFVTPGQSGCFLRFTMFWVRRHVEPVAFLFFLVGYGFSWAIMFRSTTPLRISCYTQLLLSLLCSGRAQRETVCVKHSSGLHLSLQMPYSRV